MIKVQKVDKELKISFAYSVDRIMNIKKLNGYRWDPHQKAWFIPYSKDSLMKLEKLFLDEEIIMELQINDRYQHTYNLMREELVLKGYSYKTIKSYLGHIRRFASFINKPLTDISKADIKITSFI